MNRCPCDSSQLQLTYRAMFSTSALIWIPLQICVLLIFDTRLTPESYLSNVNFNSCVFFNHSRSSIPLQTSLMLEKTRVLICCWSLQRTLADIDSVDEERRREHFLPGESLLAVRRRFFPLQRVWAPVRAPAAAEPEKGPWTRSLSHLSPHY